MPQGRRAIISCLVLLITLTFCTSALQDAKAYCQLLQSEIPNRVAYPETPTYNESISSYYSGQERDIRPGCIFQPETAHEVSQFIKLITRKDATCSRAPPQFAIRSGGHMIWPGSANIDQGITVDLRKLNSLVLNEDKTVASLGVGGIWSDIYPQLVPHNLTVMGGRVTGIGVGGLATGGTLHHCDDSSDR